MTGLLAAELLNGIRDENTALGEQVLDISKTEREAMIAPVRPDIGTRSSH